MIRKVFKKRTGEKSKIDKFIDKYNLPKPYFAVNRRMITRGMIIGLFFALIPMPSQILATMALTPFIKFNVPVAITMVFISNPITMPPMFYVEYLTGNFLLGLEGVKGVELTVDWFWNNLDDIVIPLYVGTAFYAFTIPPLVYFLVNRFWISSVNKERSTKQEINKNREKKEEEREE